MKKSTLLLRTILIFISILWFTIILYISISIFLETPEIMTKNDNFRKESIEPVVDFVKGYLAEYSYMPSDSIIAAINKDALLITNGKRYTDEIEIKPSEIPQNGWIIAVYRGGWLNEGYQYYISWQDKYSTSDYGWDDGWIELVYGLIVGITPLLIILLIFYLKKKQNLRKLG
jgi:hypothetical protein